MRRAATTGGAVAAVLVTSVTVTSMNAPALAGSSSAPSASSPSISVGATQPAFLVSPGSAAAVALRVTTSGGAPLSSAVTIHYATRGGSAKAGVDFTAASGSVTFAAGTASGATRVVRVDARPSSTPSTAKTIDVALTGPSGVTVAATPRVVIDAHGLPYLDARNSVGARVADLMSRMTLMEKIGQMTQAERADVYNDPSLIATWNLGSVLSGGGSTPPENTPQAWADMIDMFQRAALSTRLQIPLMYGIDTVHGDGNMYGATIFPHNIGIGASRDPAIARAEEHVTADEARSTGKQWGFAPCICAAQDDRWGRTYESYSEDSRLVSQMETSIDGFQGRNASGLAHHDRILATAKHYAGDGDTEYGTGSGDYTIDQGITVTNWTNFWRKDLRQYVPAVRVHKVGSVMPSYSSVDWIGDGVGNPIKMHANRALITGVLKRQIGFTGMVISDYQAIHQLPGTWPEQVRVGVNAGTDMFMEPGDYQSFETTLRDQIDAGNVTMARINDAVRRILTKKFQLGLFDHPFTNRTDIGKVGSAQHRAVARRAAAESQVLLKNRGHALPLSRTAKIYVAGSNADNIGNQAGGWTITWQGEIGDTIPGTTILQGMREVAPHARITYSADASAPISGYDVGVVVVGETPYAEGYGDVGGPLWAYDPTDNGKPRPVKDMMLTAADKAAVDKVCSAVRTCVVSVVSGRPLQIDRAQRSEIDALVASWLPGSEGEGVADVLFGNRPFTARLPMTWPKTVSQEPINVGDAHYAPLYPYGWGLRTGSVRAQLRSARNALAAAPGLGHAAHAAVQGMNRLLRASAWRNGSLRPTAANLRLVRHIARRLDTARVDSFAVDDALVSVVRDVAIGRSGSTAVSTREAKAVAMSDHALAGQHVRLAVVRLERLLRQQQRGS